MRASLIIDGCLAILERLYIVYNTYNGDFESYLKEGLETVVSHVGNYKYI